MDWLLTRVYSISNHPVADLSDAFRIKYVKGLASCLFTLSRNFEIVKLILTPYAQSILRNISFDSSFWRGDKEVIKTAISLQHKGFKFFSMKYNWFFDVFYLLQACNPYDYSVTDNTYSYLNLNICNVFNKGALRYVYQHITKNSPGDKISSSLREHKSINDSFIEEQEKKVLIVANVSAGKSTLINSLTGYRTNKVKTTSCTSHIGYIYNKPIKDGITILDEHKNYFYFKDIKEEVFKLTYTACALHFNSSLSSKPICFIDTPGLNNAKDINHKTITTGVIKSENYDALIYVSTGSYSGTNDEYEILLTLKDIRKPIIFILNQLDRCKSKEDSISKMLNDYKSDLLKMGFTEPVIVPISARAALFLKESADDMDEDDAEERTEYYNKFQKSFFNLPSYSCNNYGKTPLDYTGIGLLEDTISNILFSES